MKEEKKPFFARLLESVEEKELNSAKAGACVTMKYPSDNDEDILK